MECLDVMTIMALMITGFVAATVDAVVGGGGLITVPALLWTGIPPVVALGTNKVASVLGACASVITFVRSGRMNLELVKKLFPCSLIGSGLGVLAVRAIPAEFLRPLVVVMLLLVAVYSIVKKDWGHESTYQGMSVKILLGSMTVAFVFGFYDGFFGPGTGSFLLFSFLLLGFDFLGAAANARALNFGSNLSAAVLFSWFGSVEYAYALPMGGAMIVGGWFGAKLALKKGATFVRPLFILMTTILIGKQLYDLLK